MNKHTPGPWVKSGHFIYGPIHAESRHTNGRVLIAEVVRGSHRADPQLDGGADRFEFDSEADARLIAAAPETAAELDRLKEINAELLEACKDAVADMPNLIIRKHLQAAIAKAEGEVNHV